MAPRGTEGGTVTLEERIEALEVQVEALEARMAAHSHPYQPSPVYGPPRRVTPTYAPDFIPNSNACMVCGYVGFHLCGGQTPTAVRGGVA